MRQDRLSEYWYAKATMPDSMRANIGALVSGDFAGDISLGGSTTRLLKVDGEVFGRVFTMNREFLYRGDYTAPSDENDYRNADNYLTEDGIAGFSITETGWLVSLFSNCSERGFARAVAGFVSPRAYKLTCIVTDKNPGGGLIELYEKCYGFRPYARTIDDTDVMREHYGDRFMDAFVDRHGIPFHLFMIGRDAAGQTSGMFSFPDYFEAVEFVDDTVGTKAGRC